MAKFQTILFDVDGTLLDFHKTEKEALTNTFNTLGIELTKSNFTLYAQENDALWKKLEEGKIDKDKLKTERFKSFFDKAHIKMDEHRASETYIDYLSRSFFYIDGARKICEKLMDNYNLAIVTNGIAKVQHSRIKKSGLDKYFKNIFISDEIGFPKPKIEFFYPVFDKMNIKDLQRVIIVGDSLTSDIKGGNNADIATCWYNPDGKKNNTDSICDYEIKNLHEIMEIVE